MCRYLPTRSNAGATGSSCGKSKHNLIDFGEYHVVGCRKRIDPTKCNKGVEMASTEERVRKLVSENLEVDGQPLSADLDLNSSLIDAGVSSVDVVAFARVIQDEFGIQFAVEDCTDLTSLAALVEFLDARAA